jgi:hypothetical protein
MNIVKQEKRTPLKDKPLRLPGQSLDQQIRKLQLEIAGYLVFSVFLLLIAYLEWTHWFFHSPPQPIFFTVVAILFLAYGSYKIIQIQKSVEKMRLGRDGERIVGETLQDLIKQGCTVFHDVIGKGFNVDHVVVSPQGIFVIETKTYKKPPGNPKVSFDGNNIMIPGRRPDSKPIQQAIANADWIRKDVLYKGMEKSFPVTPVVVFPGWYVDETNSGHIWVLNNKGLAPRISRESKALSPEEVYQVSWWISRLVRTSE